MERDQHQEWLAELAAHDGRRRREAEPELARKEAALKAARMNLARSEAAVQQLEAEIIAERQRADEAKGG